MKLHKKKILFTLGLLSLSLAVWFFPINAFAFNWPWEDDTEDIVKFLKSHSDWLQYGSFFPYMLHALAWALIKGLYFITSTLEGLIPETLSLLDFLDDSGLQGMTKAIMNDLVLALMILTLVYLGFKTIIAKQPPNFKSVGVNIFISSFLLLGLPTLMDALQDVSTQFYDATQTSEDGENSGLSWNLIKENTADLVYVAENGFDLIENDAEGTEKNALKPSIFKRLDMAQIITPEAIDDIQADDTEDLDALKYTLTTDGSGEYQALEIDDGWLSFFSDNFDTGYFRFPAKFLPMFVGLTALGFAYFFTIFVFATTIIEIGIKRIVALFVFATDLESGQRTKQVVMDICNAFMLIGFTGLMFRFYTLFLTFLGSSDVNIFIYLVAIVSATFILIKGSNTIMKYFGIDVGLKDGFAQMAGALGVAAGAASLAKKAGGSVSNMANKKQDNNSTKDKLADEANEDGRSVNDGANGQNGPKKLGGLKGSVNSAGKALGYMNERGLGGMAEDALKGTGTGISNAVKQGTNAVNNGVQGVKDSFNEGAVSGALQAQDNKDRWSGSNKVGAQAQSQLNSENAALQANQNENKANTLQGKTDQNIGSSGTPSGNSVNNTSTSNTGDSPTMNASNGKGRTNEEILATMKLQEAAMPTKSQEIAVNVKANSNGDIPSGSDKSIRQDVATSGPTNTPDAVQRISKQLDGTSLSSPESSRQSIIQDVQQGSMGTNTDVKQKVVQDVQRAASGTPDQLSQKVVQDVQRTASGTPDQLSQKVVQDVQRAASGAPDQLSQKVVQDVQRAASGAPDQLSQKVVQDVQRAASGAPDQLSQKVVQDIQTTSGGTKAAPINFSERLNNYESRKETKPSRFNFINKK
ncbi:pLS20_p028 family conjugation system transmembrane protein (plasmid) [Niallia taxi]|uniref:pLS20_p028 family conjugation system transmembrane protein n=1 Tax=Niallia taxi TaxID=2499688 RepID=UPI003F6017EC